MKKKIGLTGIIMLVIAIIFLTIALTHTELGSTFYVFGLEINSDVQIIFYAAYFVIMLILLVGSLLMEDKE